MLCGLAFGLLDVALMLPMSFPDKRAAIAGAFVDRFAIGFLICVIDLPLPGMGHWPGRRAAGEPSERYRD